MTKRAAICKKVYLSEDGTELQRTVTKDAKRLQFSFIGGGSFIVAPEDFGEEIVPMLTLFGISEKLGNAYAGAKGDVSQAEEMFVGMLENLKDGSWNEGSSGPRIGLLVDVIRDQLVEKGESVDAARLESIRIKLQDNDVRTSIMNDPKVKAVYLRKQAEAAIKRAEAAAEAVGDDESEVMSAF